MDKSDHSELFLQWMRSFVSDFLLCLSLANPVSSSRRFSGNFCSAGIVFARLEKYELYGCLQGDVVVFEVL